MAAPQTPQPGRQPSRQQGAAGPRRPRAWLARRTAAILSAVAVFALGGLMYWNDHQTSTAQAATTSNSSTSSNSSNSSNGRVYRSGDGEGDGGSEHEHEGGDSSIVDDITKLIPGLSDNSSSSSSSSSGSSNSGTPSPAPAPHSTTRGS